MPYRNVKSAIIKVYGAILLLAGTVTIAATQSSVPIYELESVARIPVASSINTQLYDLLEQLESDIRDLTGKVEMLQQELKRVKRDEKARYLDMDRRITVLNQRQNEAGQSTFSNTGIHSTNITTANVLVAKASRLEVPAVMPVAPMFNSKTEEADYKAAFGLITALKYEQAELAMQAFVVNYPAGDYTSNGYYWLGELYMVRGQYNEAVKAFKRVTSQFPNHRKVPDALYKIGSAYHKLGQADLADNYLKRVISRYPKSSSARLAGKLIN